MKKLKILFPFFLVLFFTIQSCKKDDIEEVIVDNTFTVKVDGELANNKTYTYSMIGIDGELGFNVTNNKSSDIKLKVTVVDLVGNGDGLQLCFNSCTAKVVLDYEDFKTLSTGQTTTSVQTHIVNASSGDLDTTIKLKINQVDSNDVDIPNGKEVYFTYKYVAP